MPDERGRDRERRDDKVDADITRLTSEMSASLARIDERTKSLQRTLDKLEGSFVTKVEFKPVRLAVYGAVALLLTLLLTAVFRPALVDGSGSSSSPAPAPTAIVEVVEVTPPPLVLPLH